MIKQTLLLSTVLLVANAGANPRHAFVQVDGVWQRNPNACGTHQVPALGAPFAPAPLPAVGLRTVYLNKNGGMYTNGNQTNSSTNVTRLGPATFTIPPLDTNTFDWPTISACVKAHFTPFNVRIVETEPTSGMYIEAVVGGFGTEIGFGMNELFGIASADNFCNVTERGIAFNFSETHRQVPRKNEELCATIAHEVGHLLALEHEQLAPDLMSYVLIANSMTKAFVDQTSGCGTSTQNPSSCSCSGSNTNSHARLEQFIGLRDMERVAPELNVTAPGDDTLPPTFDVLADATDNAAMSDVVVLIDDVEVGNDFEPTGSTYQITARNVSEGAHTLSVIATDVAGNLARKDISITVKKLATGETCVANEVCTGGLCAQSLEGMFCTQACDPAASTCPDGFDCALAGAQNICIPGEGSGCCSSSTKPGPVVLLAFMVGALLFRRRRR